MRRNALLLVLLVFALASASIVNAQSVEQYTPENNALRASRISVSYSIAYEKALVDTQITFAAPSSGLLEVRLPLDARAITLRADKQTVEPGLDYNLMRFNLNNNTNLRYQYISESVLEKDSFIANIRSPVDADELYIKVSLPESALLEKRVSDEGDERPSVFPGPSSLQTDGRVIDIVWFVKDVRKGDDFPVLARYSMPVTIWPIILIIITLFLIAIVLFLALRNTRKRNNVVILKPKHHQAAQSGSAGIEKHLKEDEEQIVTILKDREGQCEQGTMRVITGFSKAKLSGLLKELEERKLIHKEKRGKKNLVFLKR
jgi:uncharacterized membrane protein